MPCKSKRCYLRGMNLTCGGGLDTMTDLQIEGLSTTGLISCEPHHLAQAFDDFPMLKELLDRLSPDILPFSKHAIYRFANGYGASVVSYSLRTMGAPVEVAAVTWKEDDYSLQGNPLRCSIEDANALLYLVAILPAPIFGILPANCASLITEA